MQKAYQCPDCGGDCKSIMQAMQQSLEQSRKIQTNHGYCHDCAQGLQFQAIEGFELYVLDSLPSHWFCRYCGSNHVTIRDEQGNIIAEEGDLYVVPKGA